MTEWTSISVTDEQKDDLIEAKPENQPMGQFLIGLLEDTPHPDVGATVVDAEVPEDAVRDAVEGALGALDEDGDRVLVDELVKRLASDVEMAAYRGARDALEEKL